MEYKHASNSPSSAIFLEMANTRLEMLDGLRQNDLLTVKRTDSAATALRALCDENVLSAPVVDSFGSYIGILSMTDLVAYALTIFDQNVRPDRFSQEYLNRKQRWNSSTVNHCMGKPSLKEISENFYPIREDFSLFHAFETMVTSGQHRLALVDSVNRCTGVITQSMLLRWVLSKLDTLSSEIKATRVDAIRPFNIVKTIPVTRRAIDALKMIRDESLSAVAVVDSEGRIVDVLSQSDLRGINPESMTFRFLWNTIDFFKDQVRTNNPYCPATPICVTPDATFEQVLLLMEEHHCHRVFVITATNDRKPVDVVSMTDCMAFLLTFLQTTPIMSV